MQFLYHVVVMIASRRFALRSAIYRDQHLPIVMTAKILGGDDGNRQNLGVGDLRPHITAMPADARK